VDKVIVFERAGLLFIFNFHTTESYTDYRVGVEHAGDYHIVLSSDDKQYAGWDRVDLDTKFTTTALAWNGRKNFLQVSKINVSIPYALEANRIDTGLHPIPGGLGPGSVLESLYHSLTLLSDYCNILPRIGAKCTFETAIEFYLRDARQCVWLRKQLQNPSVS